MSMKLTQFAYQELIDGNLEWLSQFPDTLERAHIEAILKDSVQWYYLTKTTGIERAIELRQELFDIANSYAGDETGNVAVMLHGACNNITKAESALSNDTKKDEE